MAVYATVEELKDQIGKTAPAQDAVLKLLLKTASEQVDKVTNRPLGWLADTTATTKTFVGNGSAVQYIYECAAVTVVEVKDSPSDTAYVTWDTVDYITAAGPIEAPEFEGIPITMIIVSAIGTFNSFTSGKFTGLRGFRKNVNALHRSVPTVRITARWGNSDTVPPLVNEACLIQASRWYQRGKSGWARAIGQPEFGTLRMTGAFQLDFDEDVRAMLVGSRLIKPAIGKRY